MIEGRLGRRYAKALFDLAREVGEEEKIGQEIDQLHAAYSGSELQGVLTNPALSLDRRKNILIQVSKSQQLSRLTTNFVLALLERDRLAYLPGIVTRYRELLNQAKGRVEAKVVGASPLEPEMLDRVREVLAKISGKKVVLQQETDAGLIGGLLVGLQDTIYDGSVRTQLEKMKQRIARGY
jgi:F-type H+-transporting ATPase subunit delta